MEAEPMDVRISFDEKTISVFERIATATENNLAVLERIAAAVEGIKANTAPSPFAVAFQILIGETLDMKKGSVVKTSKKGKFGQSPATPVPITDAPSGQKVAVVGIDAQGAYGAPLATGASILISAANGANGVAAVFTADPTPAAVTFTDASGVVHTNVPSLASGLLVASTPPDINDPFVVSYAITLAGGAAGDTGSATLEVVPGTEASEVLVFPTS
jgi:hypothetical protein